MADEEARQEMKVWLLAVLLLVGCNPGPRRVVLYSGGQPVRTWHITGLMMKGFLDGEWIFWDSDGNQVRVSGDIVVEHE